LSFYRLSCKFKGFRFYCPNYGTQIVETGCAKFIEYEENATRTEDFTFEEEGDVVVIENVEPDPTTLIHMIDIAPAPHNDQLELPQFEEPGDQQEEQQLTNLIQWLRNWPHPKIHQATEAHVQ
ncbi:unnamed protein product, partial [Prunus brigantina]